MKTIRFEIDAQIPWRACLDQESGTWIGVCDALSVTSMGETWNELVDSIQEIHAILFRDLLEEGKLESFLMDRGWKPVTAIPTRNSDICFDIPFNIHRVTGPEIAVA